MYKEQRIFNFQFRNYLLIIYIIYIFFNACVVTQCGPSQFEKKKKLYSNWPRPYCVVDYPFDKKKIYFLSPSLEKPKSQV